jgi:ketosteroid isomerase-like protein
MRRLTLSVLSLAFLAACQPGVAPLTDEDATALENGRAAYIQATLAGDCDAQNATFAENAVVLPQDQPTVEGRAAIKAACEAEEATIQDFTLTSLEVDGYGDLAFDRGTWSETIVTEDMEEPLTLTGKYLTILRKQADGSWLVTVDIWNTDAPMPQPEQP